MKKYCFVTTEGLISFNNRFKINVIKNSKHETLCLLSYLYCDRLSFNKKFRFIPAPGNFYQSKRYWKGLWWRRDLQKYRILYTQKIFVTKSLAKDRVNWSHFVKSILKIKKTFDLLQKMFWSNKFIFYEYYIY